MPLIHRRVAMLADRIPPGQVDLVDAFTDRVPLAVLCDLLGLPPHDADRLQRWCRAKSLINWGRPRPNEQHETVAMMTRLWFYCRNHVNHRRVAPRGDLTSDLLEHADDDLTDRDIASMIYALLLAGHATTAGLISHTLRYLLASRHLWDRIGEDTELLDNVIQDVLRLDPPVIAWRRITTRPITLHSTTLPTRAPLLLSLAAANRDPSVFPHPDALHPGRGNAREHLSFGHGLHYCLGHALARRETRIAIQALRHRFPHLRLDAARPPTWPDNIAFRGPTTLRAHTGPLNRTA